jgi:hypothetical protein
LSFARRARRAPRESLRQTLDAIHRKREVDGRAPRKLTFSHASEHGKVVRSKCGPNGEMREHPNIDGLQWLKLFAEALRMHGMCAENRVDVTDWEKTGCVTLHLERVQLAEAGQSAIRLINGKLQRQRLKAGTPMSSRIWESWQVPTGMLNNHDVRAMLRLLMEPRGADLVLGSNPHLQAINGH